jgi:uncharacterized Ntn-hydrolase superfamily protein
MPYRSTRLLAAAIFTSLSLAAQDPPPTVSTFSIVGYDAKTHEWGVAVASRYFSVGSVVPWAEAGVGAVATQANVNVGYGPRAIELLKQGLTAKQVIEKLLADDTFEGKDGRQIGIIDAKGNVAGYTGPKAPNWAGDVQGENWTAQGNILVGAEVPKAMGRAFEATKGDLAEKLYAALKAGDDAGGDSRGRQSASMLVVGRGLGRNYNNDRPIYINVDDNPAPLPELRRLLDLNQAALYQGRIFNLVTDGKIPQARDAAATLVGYTPNQAGAFVTLGMLSYVSGDKPAALAAFQKAGQLNPDFRKQFDAVARRPAYKAILEDREFLAKLFPEK